MEKQMIRCSHAAVAVFSQLMMSTVIWCLSLSIALTAATNPVANISRSKPTPYPYGVHYEIFVRAFCDSNGDGIGDIKGMTSKLDYLQELGVSGIWLMPIFKSPSYHKYDITDYYAIDPEYGTLEDFKVFLAEAHKRNIGVTIDFVVNHTSSKHPWFLDALSGTTSKYRSWYNWASASDTTKKWNEAWKNGWKTIGDTKVECIFWEEMPDLNFDNPAVRKEVINIATYWLKDIGVDGLRIDAAMHLYGQMIDKSLVDNAKSSAFWGEFRKVIQRVKPNAYLIGEVWSSDTLMASYHKHISTFNFPAALAIEQVAYEGNSNIVPGHWIGDTKPIPSSATRRHFVDYLNSVYNLFKKENPRFLDAPFLTNHDQERVMSDMKNDKVKAGLAAKILLTIPGSPYLYYGEEIGMMGKKPDEYLREPMRWDKKGVFAGETRWVDSRHNADSVLVPVAQQDKDSTSLLHLYRIFVRLRNTLPALASGDIQAVKSFPPNILSYVRTHKKQSVLVIHNLSNGTIISPLSKDVVAYTKPRYVSSGSRIFTGGVQIAPGATIILEK